MEVSKRIGGRGGGSISSAVTILELPTLCDEFIMLADRSGEVAIDEVAHDVVALWTLFDLASNRMSAAVLGLTRNCILLSVSGGDG